MPAAGQGRRWRQLAPADKLAGQDGLALRQRNGWPAELEEEFVYVVRTERGQETLTPAVFAQKYGWKNDPEKAVRK